MNEDTEVTHERCEGCAKLTKLEDLTVADDGNMFCLECYKYLTE